MLAELAANDPDTAIDARLGRAEELLEAAVAAFNAENIDEEERSAKVQNALKEITAVKELRIAGVARPRV